MKIKLSELSRVLGETLDDYAKKHLVKMFHTANQDDPRIPDVEYTFVSEITFKYFMDDVQNKVLNKENNNDKEI